MSVAIAQIDTSILKALKNRDGQALEETLKNRPNINAVDITGANALMWAVYYGDLMIVKKLILHGAVPSDSGVLYVKATFYGSLQGIAAYKGYLHIFKYLIDSLHLPFDDKEFDSRSRKHDGWTPLSYAAYYGNLDIVKYLLQKKVSINAANKNSMALLQALEKEHWSIFTLLMNAGAKEKLTNRAGYFITEVEKFKKLHRNSTDYKQNLTLKELTLELAGAYLGQDHPYCATLLENQAKFYLNYGKEDLALALFQKVLAVRRKLLGEEHPDYAETLNSLGAFYRRDKQYEKAINFFLQALAVRKKILRVEHPDYVTTLVDLAALYRNLGQYDNAITFIEQVLAIAKNLLGEDNMVYTYYLNEVAGFYIAKAQYPKALLLLNQSLNITKKLVGQTKPAYRVTLLSLANVYSYSGQYEEALRLYLESLALRKKIGEEVDDNEMNILGCIGDVYMDMGQYEKALPIFQRVIALKKDKLGEWNDNYARSLISLAKLYRKIGQYQTALPLLEQALSIRKKVLSENHPSYTDALNLLGNTYSAMGQFQKALPFIQQALQNAKMTGEENHIYSASLNSLALLYLDLGRYAEALPLLQQSLDMTKKIFGETHPSYAINLKNLARLYKIMGKYEIALPFFQQALDIGKMNYGKESPDYADDLLSLSGTYNAMGNHKMEVPLLLEASHIKIEHLKRTYHTLSEAEKMIFLRKQSIPFYVLPSILLSQRNNPDFFSLFNEVYQTELTLKGMILEDQQGVINSIRKSNDSGALKLYKDWRSNKNYIGKQLLLPKYLRVRYLDSLQAISNEQEQQLSLRSINFRERHQSIQPANIQQKLPKGEAAIEFIRFPFYNKKWTDSVVYAALLLLPIDTAIRFIPLFEEKQLLELLKRSRTLDYRAIEGLYGSEKNGLNDSLYQLIWKPLQPFLRDIHTIYYAPVGLLNRIAFPALKTDPSRFLIDSYQLNEMLSTRSLAFPAQTITRPKTAAIWGDIVYGMDKSNLSAPKISRGEIDTTISAFSFALYNEDNRASRGGAWASLPGTKIELDSIQRAFKMAGIPVTAKRGNMASEEAFKMLDGKGPQVLHMATHGFFLPSPTNRMVNFETGVSNNFTTQQDPLFRSGLVLASGNYAWEGNPAIPGREDGILTAYEIAQMDLSGTDLVVLSACETALGDLPQNNEGVFGLQRALKLAGVKQMIVSLWKVPDQPTMELMTMFYRNWLSGQTTREALRNAQLKTKEKYKEPFYWAAFILVE